MKQRPSLAIALILFLAYLIVGCGGGALNSNHGSSASGSTSTTSTTSGSSSSGADGGTLVSATKGGIISSADGKAVVVIAANALSKNTKISINPATVTTLPAAPQNMEVVQGTAFTLGPEGQFFNKTCSLSLVYDPAQLPSGISERDLQIYTVVNGAWQPVLTGQDDPTNHVISTPLAHFSTYAVLSLTSYTGGPTYDLVDLGVVSGDTTSVPTGISADGRVVGISTAATGMPHAFQWSNNLTLDLGKRAGDIGAKAYCINASGLAGGTSIQNTIKAYPVLFQYGGVTQVNTAYGQTNGTVTAVNDNGTYIVESAIVQSSTLTAFSGFGASTNSSALNANDQVAGYTNGHAAIWSNGVVTDAGLLKGYDTAVGTAISDAGELVGLAYNAADKTPVGFLYANSKMTMIPPLTGDDICSPAAVNGGMIVGTSSTDYNAPRAFIMATTASTPTNLNTLVPTNSGWIITQALGINPNGQIIGTGVKGTTRHALLLVPRPGTFIQFGRTRALARPTTPRR